jgi:hypothetical protein
MREVLMPWMECSVTDERVRFVGRLLDGEAMSDVCRSFGISRKTGYKIFNRYRDEGLEALTDRSRPRPPGDRKFSSGQTSPRSMRRAPRCLDAHERRLRERAGFDVGRCVRVCSPERAVSANGTGLISTSASGPQRRSG